ncbi:Cysteine protease atg4 [Batrachochytrium dendrobatidis]|nr:Cysteine protease atg4 [Batrachochytrium dendrobatidis]KAK5672889.1 Cysteine protease atg4 [Batrachochytrium dendrobatidis]
MSAVDTTESAAAEVNSAKFGHDTASNMSIHSIANTPDMSATNCNESCTSSTPSDNNPNHDSAAHVTTWSRLSGGLSLLMTRALHSIQSLDMASELSRFTKYHRPYLSSAASSGIPTLDPNSPIVFLAQTYSSLAHPHFLDDFHSRLWMTYRKGFAAIKPTGYTCDSGWGCMLRSGQMLVANALLFHELGRDWRLGDSNDRDTWLTYCSILTKFLDVNTSPYSIQRIATLGIRFDKQIGEWFGPSTISQVLKVLVNDDQRISLKVHVSNDGVVYKNEINTILSATRDDGKTPAVLIMIPLRLGVETMNPVYYPGVKHCFAMSHCVGIAGGRPNSSLFFLGVDGDHLIYLDPHHLRPSVDSRDITSYKMEDLLSYHCEKVRLLPIASMDPSLVIGFYCHSLKDFDVLCAKMTELATGSAPLFSIEEMTPDFDPDVDIISEYDF